MRKEERLERKKSIRHFRDLEVYRRAFDAAMQLFEVTKKFPLKTFCQIRATYSQSELSLFG